MGIGSHQYWLVKFAPFRTSWHQIVQSGIFKLRGVRSYEARYHLRKMQLGDPVLFYHSQQELAIVGLMKVSRTAYPDPTSSDPQWLTCDFIPIRSLSRPITLTAIKSDPRLVSMGLVRRPRLAVMSITREQYKAICSERFTGSNKDLNNEK